MSAAMAGHREQVVYLVDDDESLRRALTRLLNAAGYKTRDYASVGHFLLDLAEPPPGCVLLDVQLPGPSGFDLHQTLLDRDIALPVIFMTGYGDISMGVRAMKSGAVDFLTKPVDREALLDAVRSALSRNADEHEARETRRTLRSRYQTLSRREREVFALVVTGKLNKQIASEIGTSERTVKAHRAQVMDKMQVKSVAELVHAAETLSRSAAQAA
jgi:FixJ family two-component response regulator